MKARLDRHGRYRELLAARLDRPLTRAENRLLVGHLKTCADCQQTERDYLAQGALLRSMPTPIPPRDMWARTSTALDREVSRWSYRYPRFGRRAIVRDRRARSGTPSALATMVAAVGVVTVLAILQFGPALRPAPSTAVAFASAISRPTPFAVAPQPLAVLWAGESDLTVYQTQVTQFCPASAPDCMEERDFVSRSVPLRNLRPENIAMSPSGGQIAFVGHDTDQDVITVVLLRDDTTATNGSPQPTRRPAPTATSAASEPPPSGSPSVDESPQIEPTRTDPPVDPSLEPSTTAEPTPANPGPDGTSTADTPSTPSLEASPGGPSETPPPSVVPGLTVLSILEDVHSAGAPPAWSGDGEVLAFSAMPADGSHGPDVYVWQPGDDQARPITSDHSSYFASWSGRRIVASRLNDTNGKSDSLAVLTVVIDPMTLEERRVRGPLMWLPVVDPQGSHAVTWSGSLDLTGDLPSIQEGALYLVDWSALDPFAAEEGEPPVPPADVHLVAIDPTRDTLARPVLDWHVRWSLDGRVLGIWEADAPGATLGKLVLAEFDPEAGVLSLDEPLMSEWSKRGFTLGVDRVAWVSPSSEGTEGELRIRTWGVDGVGDLSIESLNLEGLVPAF